MMDSRSTISSDDETDDCTGTISPVVKTSINQQQKTSIDVSSINKRKYLTITYTGHQVQERWSRDFQLFSQARSLHSWQLFGFTDSVDSPSLIFHYQELLPLEKFYNDSSPILKAYLFGLYCHFGSQRRKPDNTSTPSYMGGHSERSFNIWTSKPFHLPLIPLPHTYRQDTQIIQQMTLIDFDKFLCQTVDLPISIPLGDSTQSPVYQLGSVYYNRNSLLGCLPITSGFSPGPVPWKSLKRYSNGIEIATDKGWNRTKYKLQDIYGKHHEYYSYACFDDSSGALLNCSWISQAAYVLSQWGLNMDPSHYRNVWVIQRIEYRLRLDPFELGRKPFMPAFLAALDVFLFLPLMILDERGAFYASEKPFWSFDPSGETKVSERSASFIGLSKFSETLHLRTGVSGPGRSNYVAVEAIRDYQILKGYDLYTNQYAKDQGYPLFRPCNGKGPLTDKNSESAGSSSESSKDPTELGGDSGSIMSHPVQDPVCVTQLTALEPQNMNSPKWTITIYNVSQLWKLSPPVEAGTAKSFGQSLSHSKCPWKQ
ncbi:hypothetical protein BT96DRAFT_454970 [Gymnopus androsaceus JB14]|uniref:Uncharacterized protein n=1 Tax=Gymnopus androsaceus JB14 TaxID=1447944 RepID=A0A6A4GR42_9AGAR|nr:hypothetical protein BT96DRAFT_454970 [Gymnopus androsaceus JB14]